ncbi:MAG: precorrin-6y C5,15-methyltransferase (decarboxylating) subunit CbiE [Actinomycetales bacterium]|nr:MAG: precorrin-6y C5,15-methyltransferase (decarboxylating) subunit CbiE [Actinomycetales bacterium]
MIRVYGYIGRISEDLRRDVSQASVVVGGRRHLDILQVPEEKRVILGKIAPAVEKLSELSDDELGVVVASGDPLLFGVVRRMRQAGLKPEVIMAPSSIQLAFAAIALPWDDAKIVSAHAHDIDPTVEICRKYPKVAVLTAPERGINDLAQELADIERWYVLAEKLGEPEERVLVLDQKQAATVETVSPNVVLVLAYHPDDPRIIGQNPAIQGEPIVVEEPTL